MNPNTIGENVVPSADDMRALLAGSEAKDLAAHMECLVAGALDLPTDAQNARHADAFAGAVTELSGMDNGEEEGPATATRPVYVNEGMQNVG